MRRDEPGTSEGPSYGQYETSELRTEAIVAIMQNKARQALQCDRNAVH